MPVASALRQNWSVSPCRMQGGWRWLAQSERCFVFSSHEKIFRCLQVLYAALVPLPVFRIPFPLTFYYFYNESEQLVVTVKNSITYNTVNRSICGRDVPWIHSEKTQFSNLMLLSIHTSASFTDLEPPSFLQAFSRLFILHLQKKQRTFNFL